VAFRQLIAMPGRLLYYLRSKKHPEARMRSIAKVVLLCAAVLIVPAKASAGERPIVAVFDMEDRGSGLDKEVLANLTDYLASLLAEGGYQVIPRDQIRERLTGEQKESYKACYDQACQIELGRELAAQKVLATQILKIGKTCQVTSNLYDLKRTATELAANASAECDVDSLLGAVRTVAAKLSGQLTGKIYEETRREEEKQAAEQEAARKAAEEAAERARAAKARAQAKAKAEADRKAAERRKKERIEAEKRRIREAEAARKKKLEDRRKSRLRPLALDDMRASNKLDLRFAWLPGEEYNGFAFLFLADLAEGGSASDILAFTAEMAMSFHDPKEADSENRIGNIGAKIKYLHCIGTDWSFCFGTSTSVSLGAIEDFESADDPDKRAAHVAAQKVGRTAFQNPSLYTGDQLAFRPLGILTLAGKEFFSQLQLGGILWAPIQNMDDWEAVGFSLIYGAAVGYQVFDWFAPIVEFNGNSPLAGKLVPIESPEEETSLFINAGFVLDFDDICAAIRLTLPLTDDAQLDTDVQLGLAVSGNI
jgi:hypothetical protein